MQYLEVKKILDEFTLRNKKKSRILKRPIFELYGEESDEPDGILYLRPKPVGIKIENRYNENYSYIIYSGDIVSLKPKRDSISFTMSNQERLNRLPGSVVEQIERTESKTLLTAFNKMELKR